MYFGLVPSGFSLHKAHYACWTNVTRLNMTLVTLKTLNCHLLTVKIGILNLF